MEDSHIAALEKLEDYTLKLIEAKATIEQLKCCGNCIHGSFEDTAFMCCRKNDDSVPRDWWGDTHTCDHCHFTPSRWTEATP